MLIALSWMPSLIVDILSWLRNPSLCANNGDVSSSIKDCGRLSCKCCCEAGNEEDDADRCCSPLTIQSNSSKSSGRGLASGGTAPGSVVMALKCDDTARNAMRRKSVRWRIPPMESFEEGGRVWWRVAMSGRSKRDE